MNAKKLLITHGEKALAGVVGVLCLWSIFASLGELRVDSGRDAALTNDLDAVRRALKVNEPTPKSYAFAQELPDYARQVADHVDAVAGGRKTHARFVPAPRTWYDLPPQPKRIEKVVEITQYRAGFEKPSSLSVSAERGKVTVSWVDNPNNRHAWPIRFQVYKRTEDQPEYPSEPWKIAEGAEPPAPAPKPAARRAASVSESGKIESQSFELEDFAVEPKKTYYYKLRAFGRPVKYGENVRVLPPAGIQTVTENGTRLWVTPFTDEASDRTPSNVELLYTGTMQLDEPVGVFVIKKWEVKSGEWLTHTVRVPKGDRIAGIKPVRIGGRTKRVRIDSGYKLLKLVTRQEVEIQEKRVLKLDEDGNPMKDAEGNYIYIIKKVERIVQVKEALVLEIKTGERRAIPLTRESAPSGDDDAGQRRREDEDTGRSRRRRARSSEE